MRGPTARKLLLVLLSLVAAGVSGIEVRDIVHMADGSTVEGAIVERVPGVSYTVETQRRGLMVLPVERIERIEKLAVNPDEQAFSYQDVVILHSGLIFRGSIVQEIPNESIVLLADGGLSLTFPMEFIWRIAAEKCAAGQARSTIGQHPTGRDLRRQFRIEITINRIESEEDSAEAEDPSRLEGLRDELADLEAESATETALQAAGDASIARLRDQIAKLDTDSSDLATELAQRALVCAEGNADAEQAVLSAYGVVEDQVDQLHVTAVSRTQVDPRLLAEQAALEREMRGVELTTLLAPPLPAGPLDPSIAALVPIFSREERQEIYDELKVQRSAQPVLRNALLPLGIGSFRQGDMLGGFISAALIVTGVVLIGDGTAGLGAGTMAWSEVYDPSFMPQPRTWVGLGLIAGGYLYSLAAPTSYRARQNRRLEDVLRLDEDLDQGPEVEQ